MWMVDAHESSSSKDDWVRIRTAFLPYILRSFAERAKNFWPARRMPVARTSSGLLKALTTFCCSSVESYDRGDSEKAERAVGVQSNVSVRQDRQRMFAIPWIE